MAEKLEKPEGWAFDWHDYVEKIGGALWRGKVVGFYSTDMTPEGYAVASATETNSVQIYPRKALRPVTPDRSDDALAEERVEQVAEALWQADSERANGRKRRTAWADEGDHQVRDGYRFNARRVLAALSGDAAHTSQEKIK